MPLKKKTKLHKFTDSALYKVTSKKKLAEILLCSIGTLKDVTHQTDRYKKRWKPKDKKKGAWLTSPPPPELTTKYRPIDIPNPKLKRIQSRIAGILSRIEPPSYLFSPVKGRSYVENAAYHRMSTAFWQLDIADYFPSCKSYRIAWFFHTKMKCAPDVTAILVSLVTEQGQLPQGSPCSPILAFYCNSKMWDEIESLVRSNDCLPSVYADDISVSGQKVLGNLIWSIKKILHNHGYRLKKEKEHCSIHSPAIVTGVIVKDGELRLPNKQHKKLFELIRTKKSSKSGEELFEIKRQIQGRLAQKKQVEAF